MTKMINLWHGIPIKSMGLMKEDKTDDINLIKDDYFISTSSFFNTVMNSCIAIEKDKYKVLGYPRNDYLFFEDGKSNLNSITNNDINGKIILFMPTFRDNSSFYKYGNIFGLKNFNEKDFLSFLENNDLTIILKIHPNSEKEFSENSLVKSKRILLIKNKQLNKNKMDFYKILNAADLLVTDYSSVFFDYLLLDRPIVFLAPDLNEYRNQRGFLLEPYEQWVPGKIVSTYEELKKYIIKSLEDDEYFKKERESIKNLFHYYQDGDSTKRVLELIDTLL